MLVLSDSQQALGIVQTQFKVGSTDLRFVEQRQLALTSTMSALIRMQTEQRVQRVNLHLALGGSFERARRRRPRGSGRLPPPRPNDDRRPAAEGGLRRRPPDFSLILGGPLYQLLRGRTWPGTRCSCSAVGISRAG
jgi:hypothetical protein